MRFCTAHRADRDVCATGAIGLGRSATKPQVAKPCRHVLILIIMSLQGSNHGPHNPIRHNPSCLNSTINPSYQFISFIPQTPSGSILAMSTTLASRCPNVEYVAMCGYAWLYGASTKTPLGFSNASPLPKYEERDLEGDPSRSRHKPPDQEWHCFHSFGSSIVFQLYNHTAFEYMFDFVTSSIKVCCFEVNEDFRIAYSHPTFQASSGERVCFTSTRRFEVFADQPSPRLDTTLTFGFPWRTFYSFPKIYESCQKKTRSMVLISYRLYG